MIRSMELPDTDLRYLDRTLLNREGRLHLMSVADLRAFDPDHLRLWCYRRCRYNLPTMELVQAVKGLIGDRSAIEIGSGMGDLGGALGVPMTDSYQQTTPDMLLYYKAMGQPPIHPPPEVEKLNAVEAVTKYRPKVVVAAWVTQLFQEGDTEAQIGASTYGVDEGWVLDNCETYIFIGNVNTHKDKRILKRPHRTAFPSYAMSRAADPSKNVLWTWDR